MTRRMTLNVDEIEISNIFDIVRNGSVFAINHKNIKKLISVLIGFIPKVFLGIKVDVSSSSEKKSFSDILCSINK